MKALEKNKKSFFSKASKPKPNVDKSPQKAKVEKSPEKVNVEKKVEKKIESVKKQEEKTTKFAKKKNPLMS